MSIVKEGYMKRYTRAKDQSDWHAVFVRLYSNGYLCIYSSQQDDNPTFSIDMKAVCKHFARGENVLLNFRDKPSLPDGASIDRLLAIPEQPSHTAKPHFLLTTSERAIYDWMTAICNMFPSKDAALSLQGYHHDQMSSSQDSRRGVYPQQPYPQNPYPYSEHLGQDSNSLQNGATMNRAEGLNMYEEFGKFGQGRCASWSSIDSIGSTEDY